MWTFNGITEIGNKSRNLGAKLNEAALSGEIFRKGGDTERKQQPSPTMEILKSPYDLSDLSLVVLIKLRCSE